MRLRNTDWPPTSGTTSIQVVSSPAYRRPVSTEEIEAVVNVCDRAQKAVTRTWSPCVLDCKLRWCPAVPLSFREYNKRWLDRRSCSSGSTIVFLWSTMPDDELRGLETKDFYATRMSFGNRFHGCLTTRVLPRWWTDLFGSGRFENLNKLDIDQNKIVGGTIDCVLH